MITLSFSKSILEKLKDNLPIAFYPKQPYTSKATPLQQRLKVCNRYRLAEEVALIVSAAIV
jgi:hypothetical protein